MSYILDALRKSDQQRQRGAAPTLQMAQTAALAPKRPAYLSYGLFAAVLLGAGMAIGWLRPWQAEPAPQVAKVVAASPSEAGASQSAPARAEIASAPAPQTQTAAATAHAASAPAPQPAPTTAAAPAPVSLPARAAVAAPAKLPAPAAAKPRPPAGAKAETSSSSQQTAAPASKVAPAPESPPAAADSAPAQNVILLADLPLELQQELPQLTITVHAYSARPADRMVSINNRMLREGDYVVPGLKLEQITPEGMVFGYKGYSFRRGVK